MAQKQTENIPFLGRGIFGSGWQRQTWEVAEPRESPELTRVCEGDLPSICVSLQCLEAARFLVTRNCGDSGVGSPVFFITATGLRECLDVVEVDADVLRELFESLSPFSEALRGTISDILGLKVLENLLSQLLNGLPEGDCSGCDLVVGAVQVETNQLTAA